MLSESMLNWLVKWLLDGVGSIRPRRGGNGVGVPCICCGLLWRLLVGLWGGVCVEEVPGML